jgi:hypothetical protein
MNAYHFFIEEGASSGGDSDTAKPPNWPPKLPVATEPIWGHARALRQRGAFTIHGTDERPLEQQAGHLVDQIEIPPELQAPLRRVLREAGMDHYFMFPDLDGLARSLRQRYGWT